MEILQLIVFLIHLLFFNVGWIFGCRRYLKIKGGFTYNSASVALLLTITTVVFLTKNINKLHLIWITPLISFVSPAVDFFSIPIIGSIYLWITKVFAHIITFGVKTNQSS